VKSLQINRKCGKLFTTHTLYTVDIVGQASRILRYDDLDMLSIQWATNCRPKWMLDLAQSLGLNGKTLCDTHTRNCSQNNA